MRTPCASSLALAGVAAGLSLSAALLAPPARAQRQEPLPQALEGVGITEHLDAPIPLDLAFVDEGGNPVRLSRYFDRNRPVILTLVYYRCPMLCNLVLGGLVDVLRELEWGPGNEFEIVTVSIDPLETPTLARKRKQGYLAEYGRAGAEAGWHFLTGREEQINRLAGTVGFSFRYLEDRQQYAHAAAIFVLTPDGRLSRYLYGVRQQPETLRLALVEASEGRIGSTLDRFILYCFHYDASEGRYAPAALKIMRIAGVLTLLTIGVLLGVFWRREARRKAG